MAIPKNVPSSTGPAKETYAYRIQELLSSSSGSVSFSERIGDLVELLCQPEKSKTKIFYTSGKFQHEPSTMHDLLTLSAEDQKSGREAICVIENISPVCIEKLGSDWNLDLEFFIYHAENPHPDNLWTNHNAVYVERKYQHLDGVFEYHGLKGQNGLHSSPSYFSRHCFEEQPHPVQSNTRISYYRVSQNLYLFLVDPPLDITAKHLQLFPRKRSTLRLTYSTNRGGLLLPQLFSQANYSLFDSLKDVFQHPWHFSLLFDGERGAIPGQPFLYILSNSLWESNLRYLTKEINSISFENVRNPSLKMNNVLHDRREELAFMKSRLIETIKYVPLEVVKYFERHAYYIKNVHTRLNSATPVESHQRVLDEAVQLDKFLMETFQLLMASISVRDSQLSIQQSQSATRLTQLAFIYIPLSFVTGIFGMNVREISGTGLSVWVCFLALAIVILLTVGIFWFFHTRGSEKKGEKEWV